VSVPDKPATRIAVIVTDGALLAFIRETGIADPEELRRTIALLPGVIPAAKLGKRNWTVDGLTFHFNKPEGAITPAVTSVTSGPSLDMGGRAMARRRYSDNANNSLGNRRGQLSRKPKEARRPDAPPTEGEFDDQ
jgi:hypothetical protein